jgi:hypothetical protein
MSSVAALTGPRPVPRSGATRAIVYPVSGLQNVTRSSTPSSTATCGCWDCGADWGTDEDGMPHIVQRRRRLPAAIRPAPSPMSLAPRHEQLA